MRKSVYGMPALILALGIIGIILRTRELSVAFEDGAGFVNFGGVSSLMLIALSLIALAASIIFSVSVDSGFRTDVSYEKVFGYRSYPVFLLYVILGAVIFLGGIVYFLENKAVGINMMLPEIMVSVLAILSGIAFIIMARSAFKGKKSSSAPLLSVIPALFFCFWLVLLYKENSTNPIIWEFAYYALAIASCSMAFYFSAGFVYGKPRPCMTMITSFIGAFFCMVSLADPMRLSYSLFFGSGAFVLLLNCGCLLKNLKVK